MSWVVASIAAELWGVSLDHVMNQVRAGIVASREEFGFLWVEVKPTGPFARPPRARQWRSRRGRPKTYTRRAAAPAAAPLPLTSDELRLLAEATSGNTSADETIRLPDSIVGAPFEVAGIESVPPMLAPPGPDAAEGPEPNECESPEDPDDGVPMNWREVRSRAASTRRRPARR